MSITIKTRECPSCGSPAANEFYYLGTRFYLCDVCFVLEKEKAHVVQSAISVGMIDRSRIKKSIKKF